MHSSRQICGCPTAVTVIQLIKKSGHNSATSQGEKVEGMSDLRQRLIDLWAGV